MAHTTRSLCSHLTRRITMRIVLFTIVGVLLSYTVGWTILARGWGAPAPLLANAKPILPTLLPGPVDGEVWRIETGRRIEGFSGPEVQARADGDAQMVSVRTSSVVVGYGWPWICVVAEAQTTVDADGTYVNLTRHGTARPVSVMANTPLPKPRKGSAWLCGLNLGNGHGAPIRPAWSGLLRNTLLYGAIAWLLTLAAFDVRFARRIITKRCLRCGYDVGDLSACPECGTNTGSI